MPRQLNACCAFAALLTLLASGCGQSGVKPKPFAEILAREVAASDEVLEKPNLHFLKDPCNDGAGMVSGVGSGLKGKFTENGVSKIFDYPAVPDTYTVAIPITDVAGQLWVLGVRKSTTNSVSGKPK